MTPLLEAATATPFINQPPPRKRWLLSSPASNEAAELAAALEVPLPVAHLLTRRGVQTVSEARAFLQPSLEHLHPPLAMYGMAQAVARIRQAVDRAEPILLYGDYDVDGTTAVVLLKTAIERLRPASQASPHEASRITAAAPNLVRFHLPHRLREGYGMQSDILRRAAEQGVRLVISVDTGIRALAEAETAEALGLDLIVTDHHLPESTLPRALAVLNPNQGHCSYPFKGLCGAGVAFKLAQALLEADAGADELAQGRLRTKLLPSFLKMLAIATIADSVPLLGENRAIVALGLAALRRPASPGLRALLQVARLDPAAKPVSASDVGFRLGPRINAAGRMDVASDVVELFTTRDPARATTLATRLDTLNTERRDTEAASLAEVLARLAEPEFAHAPCLVLDGEGWHRGVLGILASRVVEAAGKPALVVAHHDDVAHGSGRSVEGFHLLAALETCSELFTRFGGHAHAVGFSLPSALVPQLRQRLVAYTHAYAASLPHPDALLPPLHCDAELPLDALDLRLYRTLCQLEPFGVENPEPSFVARRVTLIEAPRTLKERHCALRLGQNGAELRAMGWRWADRVRALALTPGDSLDLVYKLRENQHPEFGGLELEIIDLRRSERLQTALPPELDLSPTALPQTAPPRSAP